MKPKTFLNILIVIALIALAAFVVYQFVLRGNNNVVGGVGQTGSLPAVSNQQFPSGNQTSTVSVSNTSASSSQFGIVSNDPALDYFVNASNTVTLIKPDGTIESIANNETSMVSGSAIPNIISTAFSYNGEKILVTSRVGTTTQSSVFDLVAQTWTNLPNGIQSPAWSPTDYQIAYLVPSNTGSATLTVVNEGVANAKSVAITSFSMEDTVLRWPSKNTIIISDRPSAYTTGSIWLFDIPSQTLSSIVYEALATESLWNASDSALLFLTGTSNAGGQLIFQDSTGARKILSFSTLPSKCAFGPISAAASDTANPSAVVYCAVPHDQDTFSLARLPDEYDQYMYFTNDDFYSINTDTGSLNQIFSFSTANTNIDATDMKVFNNVLFFINRYDQKIYALALQ